MRARDALEKLLKMDFQTVLDIGSGPCHAAMFKAHGKELTTINLYDADIVGDYNSIPLGRFDCIWASHVLEHQPNANSFLRKCFNELHDGGILAVTVPPLKHEIVGGHVSLWNAGLLLYNLILAGFDCREASVKSYGYNISVIVRKKGFDIPNLVYDAGDIETLSEFFPFPVVSGFNGQITEHNW